MLHKDCGRKAKCLAWHCACKCYTKPMPEDNDQAGWVQLHDGTSLLIDAIRPRLGWTTQVLQLNVSCVPKQEGRQDWLVLNPRQSQVLWWISLVLKQRLKQGGLWSRTRWGNGKSTNIWIRPWLLLSNSTFLKHKSKQSRAKPRSRAFKLSMPAHQISVCVCMSWLQ